LYLLTHTGKVIDFFLTLSYWEASCRVNASATSVSSFDQNPERQLEHVKWQGVHRQGVGQGHAAARTGTLLAFVREGDTVVVHSMDRWRATWMTCAARPGLTKRGVRIEFVKESLTFTGEDSPMANLMLSVMGAFAEFERALIRERQREGIALAKQRGAYRGRKKALSMNRLPNYGSVPPPVSKKRSWPASSVSAGKPCINT
jgi:DNA invertase Pin-like site-specific DNA recombinase